MKKTTAKPVAAKISGTTPEASDSVETPKTKPKAIVAPVVTNTTSEAPTTTDVIEAMSEAPVTAKVVSKKASPKPKAAKVVPAVESEPSIALPEITMHERVGLTAGTIWHYLAEHGTTPVAKLVYELPEEEAIIQRGIGWLAQEDKITLSGGDQVETIVLKG